MPDYRRFIAYFYEYIDGKRQGNVGFVKAEQRGGMWKVHLQLRAGRWPKEELRIFGYISEGTDYPILLLGKGFPQNGSLIRKLQFRGDQVELNGRHFENLSGMWIPCGEKRCFLSHWDGGEAEPRYLFLPEEKKRSPEDGKQSESSEKQSAERPVLLPDKEAENPDEQAGSQKELRTPLLQEGNQEEPPQPREESPEGRTSRREETWEEQLSQREETQEAQTLGGEENPKVQMRQPEKNREAQTPGREENSKEQPPQPEGNREAQTPGREESPKEQLPQPKRNEELTAWKIMEMKKAAEEIQGTEEKKTENSEEEDIAGKREIEAQETGERKAETEEWMQRNTGAENPESEERKPGSGERKPGSEERKPESGENKPGSEARKPENARRTQGDETSVPSRSTSWSATRSTIQNPSQERVWQMLKKRCAPLNVFPAQEFSEGLRICPRDILWLRQNQWPVGRNSFLMQGFQRYHHLLLARRRDGAYVVGVPGLENGQNPCAALAFGFPEFKPAQISGGYPEGFGYWCRTLVF